MFRTAIIAANDVQLRWMQGAALQHRRLQVEHCLDHYPTALQVHQLIGVTPDLVFLDLKQQDLGMNIAAAIREESPRTAIIAVSDSIPARFLKGTAIAAAVASNRVMEELGDAVSHALHAVRPIRHKALYSFIPAKAGNGASTIASNLAIHLANSLSQKVLVMEADLRSGTLAIALNATPSGSIQSLLHTDEPLDKMRWEQVISRLHNVDWMFSSRKFDGALPDWADYYQLLDFAAPRYDSIVVDLPELINPATSEIVRTSNTIFIVCTQEVLSLKLAEQRSQELSSWGVPSDKIQILANRWHSREFSREDVEGILKQPLTATFPNDYPACRNAIMKGMPVSRDSKLGSAFADFAEQLSAPPGTAPRGRIARFLSSLSGR